MEITQQSDICSRCIIICCDSQLCLQFVVCWRQHCATHARCVSWRGRSCPFLQTLVSGFVVSVDESLHPDSCCRVAAPRQRGAGARVTWQVQGPSPRITILMSYGCHSEVLSSTAAHACITRTKARAGPYQQHGPRLWQQRDHCLTGWMDGRWNQRLAVTSGDLIAVMIWKNDC